MKKSANVLFLSDKAQMTNKSKTITNHTTFFFDLDFSSFIWILSLVVLFSSSISAFAQEKDLTINAQNLNYSEDGKSIVAEGSVEVSYKDIKVSGEKIVYFTDDKRIQVETGFILSYQDLDFSGQALDFNLAQRSGNAQQVKLLYKNVTLHGRSVLIEPSKISLNNADFTTCDLQTPHYHFKSRDLVLYPSDGWLISYWSVFWADGIPTMPVPIYIYDFKANEKGIAHNIPYPQFGSNDLDGSYVTQSFPWQLNRKLSGNLVLNYSEKKHFGAGIETSYLVNNENNGIAFIYWNKKDPVIAKLSHSFSFGPEISDLERFEFKLFKIPTIKQYELSTALTLNERINYEFVSMLPLLTLSLKKGEYQNINFEAGISGGFVTEESSGNGLAKARGTLNISIPIWQGWPGIISPIINNDINFYGNGTHWFKVASGFDLKKDWSNYLTTNLGYRSFIINRGASPFNFEMYRFSSADQLSAGFLAGWDSSKFGIKTLYNLPNLSPQEIDYIMRAGIHCFSVIFTYKAMRQEFNFGFAIN